MGRFGVRKSRTGLVHEDETRNKAGGVAYAIPDPSARLVATIGQLFNEPQYYPDDGSFIDPTGNDLSSEALAVIETTQAVLDSDHPEDALAIARWARDLKTGLKLRTTPEIVLATVAEDAQDSAKAPRRYGKLVGKYASHIMTRADQPRNVMAAWRALFGAGENSGKAEHRLRQIPRALQRAIGNVLVKTPEDLLAKWAGSGSPSLADVIKICARQHIRVPKLMFFVDREAWANGGAATTPGGKTYPKTFDPREATPALWARVKLGKCTTYNDQARQLAKMSKVPWEFLLSQFGQDKESARQLWNSKLSTMGYLACLRNIRNFAESGANLDVLLEKISNPEFVKSGGALPFQFLSALSVFDTLDPRATVSQHMIGANRGRKANVDHDVSMKVEAALDAALAASVDNIQGLEGNTVVLVDLSGSMHGPMSDKSILTCQGAGAILGAILFAKSEKGAIVGFGDRAILGRMKKTDSILTNVKKTFELACGWSTNAHLAFPLLIDAGIVADRVILISDMNCWDSSQTHHSTWGSVASASATVRDALLAYRRKVGKQTWLHCINLMGTVTAPTPQKTPNTSYMSGFSEQILRVIDGIENKVLATDDPVVAKKSSKKTLPTVEEIRKTWYLH